MIITLELEEFLVVGKAINKREPRVYSVVNRRKLPLRLNYPHVFVGYSIVKVVVVVAYDILSIRIVVAYGVLSFKVALAYGVVTNNVVVSYDVLIRVVGYACVVVAYWV